jgi:tetratricopeptide (TPR) repeat protein
MASDPAARSLVARVAESLGTLHLEQLRFEEARRLADQTLAEIGEGRDVETVRLRSLRAQAALFLGERVDSLRDATLALEIARELGDRTTELAALSRYIGVRSETGAATAADWADLEQLAAATGDWQRALAGLTNQGMCLLDDEAAAVFPLTDRAAELAEARGLTEDLAWVDYLRTEAAFVMGDWDSALASGRRALEVGERNAYHRLVVRTWHAVVPIAAARGDRGELAHAAAWYAAREGHFPDSPYGRLMRGAVDIRLAAAGLAPPPALSAERLAASFSDPSGPSYLDAVITVVSAWIEAGALGAARETLASLDAAVAVATTRSRLAQASVALLRAWVLHAAGAPRDEVADTARTGLDLSRRSAAPWWVLRSLRVLAAAGAATASEVAEARSIERSLRIVDPG